MPPTTAPTPHHGMRRGRSLATSTAGSVPRGRSGRWAQEEQAPRGAVTGGHVGGETRSRAGRPLSFNPGLVGQLGMRSRRRRWVLGARPAKTAGVASCRAAASARPRRPACWTCRALDGLREVERREEARLEVPGESARDDGHPRHWEGSVDADLLEGGDGGADDLLEDVHRLVAAEQAPAGEALPEDDRHREDVALDGAHPPLVDSLGGEVGKLPLHLVGSRRLNPILGFGEAEVGDEGPPVAPDEDVVGRDVAVDDAQGLAVVVAHLVGGVEAEERVEDEAHRDADVDGAARMDADSSRRSSASDAPST